jgi:hypothetical protein
MKTFDELVNDADTGKKSVIRAVQAWQYLIAKATNRQLVRYDELADLMGYPDNRPLFHILGFIMWYCSQNSLAPLTGIVVNKDGTPGPGFTEVAREDLDRKREDVFSTKWFQISPPSIEEYENAHQRSKGVADHTAA